MEQFIVNPIGEICSRPDETFIQIKKSYLPGLRGLEGFSHINVIWWFSHFDEQQCRSMLQAEQPYKGAPEVMGIFATRSPIRPNPIALTTSQVLHVDYEKGIIRIAFIDADDHTPVLDIKPYTPSLDRIENPVVPSWCAHWPKSSEESACFSWEKEFNF